MSDHPQIANLGDIVAVVTGANRGIGFEVSRQLALRGAKVVLTARDPTRGEEAAEKLRDEGLLVHFHVLDVTNPAGIEVLKEDLENWFGHVDVLVNNAGAGAEGDGSVLNVNVKAIRQALEVNCFGPLRIIQALLFLLKNSPAGRVVNISSGMGALSTMKGGMAAYRVSKTCLNSLTAILAYELEDSSITINAVCPGSVRTRMGGANAQHSVEEGADTVVWLALDAPQSLSGKFLRDRKVIPW